MRNEKAARIYDLIWAMFLGQKGKPDIDQVRHYSKRLSGYPLGEVNGAIRQLERNTFFPSLGEFLNILDPIYSLKDLKEIAEGIFEKVSSIPRNETWKLDPCNGLLSGKEFEVLQNLPGRELAIFDCTVGFEKMVINSIIRTLEALVRPKKDVEKIIEFYGKTRKLSFDDLDLLE